MTIIIGGVKYTPGMYAGKRPTGAQLAENYFKELDKRLVAEEKLRQRPEIFPTICFSRKIGVGALEIADILAAKIGYHVVDQEVLEYIAKKAKLSEKAVAHFDERYPGKLNEFATYLFGEKSFIKSDYSRHLFRAVLAIAGLTPTIFVGRGSHLILPRERIMAVRFISSDAYRIKRLANILNVKEEDATSSLDRINKEQSAFFKKVFGKKTASPYEFDMVINCDYIKDPRYAAEIVEIAFSKKFADELKG
jgi:cytidylate kinase